MSDDVAISTFMSRRIYGETYKDAVFYTWYITGKPRARRLRTLIDPSPEGYVPGITALQAWIDEFKIKAEEIDKEVDQKIKDIAIAEKVEMLERHADLGKNMQEMALRYLQENADRLNTNAAVRLLVDGVRIERESRGLPSLITEINKSDSDDVIAQINKILDGSEITELEIDDDENTLSDL